MLCGFFTFKFELIAIGVSSLFDKLIIIYLVNMLLQCLLHALVLNSPTLKKSLVDPTRVRAFTHGLRNTSTLVIHIYKIVTSR